MLRIAKNHLCCLISTCSISSKAAREESTMLGDQYQDDVKNTFEILHFLQTHDNSLKEEINKGIFLN